MVEIERLFHVDAVVFDAVGTLLKPVPAVAEAYHAHGRRFGTRYSLEQVRRRFYEAWNAYDIDDRDRRNWQTNEPGEFLRWQTIVGSVFDDVADPAALFEALWAHFAAPTSWAVYEDVPQCLQRLQREGVGIAVASNFDARLRPVLAQSPPLDAVERVFISSELAVRKPSPLFFSAVAEALRLPAGRLLMVGDDPINDLNAAHSAGWRAVLIDRQPANGTADDRLCSLDAVAERVRGPRRQV